MPIFAYLRGMFQHITKNKESYLSVLAAFLLSGLFGCASTGTPGGGLYDETPPSLKTSDPVDGATGFNKQKITLHFDENIKLDNVMDKMTVSPPQAKQPTVQSNAKTLTIELQDTLLPNTTYTFDLADAVQDNNEGNPLEGLAFSFSTGDHIDSLRISGYVLNAEDLEPITGAYVGIYSDTTTLGDSVLYKVPMQRAGRTDAYGKFSILGIAPGSYRMYALIDGNTDFMYDMNTENIAFLDSLVIPSTLDRQVQDTIWQDQDSTIIDTIKTHGEILYLPNDIVLRSFNEGKATKYLDDASRQDSVHLNIRFASKMPELPTISLLDSLESPIELIAEPNPTLDTLTYWIKDSLHYKTDTLNLQFTYLYTDTTGFDVLRTDTIAFTNPNVKKTDNKKVSSDNKKSSTDDKKAKNQDKKKKRSRKDKGEDNDSIPQITYMDLKMRSTTIDIGGKPVLEASSPVDSIDLSGIHLEVQNDSLWNPMKFTLQKDSVKIRHYTLYADPHFSPGCSYKLTIDSAAMYDIYGSPINATKIEFKEKTSEEYSHLLFNIQGVTGPAFVELLNEKDKPVYVATVKDGQAKFVNVNAGTYYARLTEDKNGNGKFDAGNLLECRQPENVYYFNKELSLRANWSLSQSWNVLDVSAVKQKPDSVKTNKPKEETEKKSRNAEYLAKLGKTPKQTNTGTTTQTGTSSRMRSVNRNQ